MKIIFIMSIFIIFITNCSGTRSQCEKRIDKEARDGCIEAVEMQILFTGKIGSEDFNLIRDKCLISYFVIEEDRERCSNPFNYLQGL